MNANPIGADRLVASEADSPVVSARCSAAGVHWPDVAAALACAVVALALRWHAAGHSLSMDELWHLAMSAGRSDDFTRWPVDVLVERPDSLTSLDTAAPPLAAWARFRAVLHPPLYVFTLRLWREVVGGGDWQAAMYSATYGVVAILFVFFAVRMQASRMLATVVGMAMAFAPVQIDLGTEVRSYALMMALSACAAWQMVRIETHGATAQGVWWLGLTMCPLMLTHYFAAGTCLAIVLWGILRLEGRFLRQLLAATAVAAVSSAILWLPQGIGQVADVGAGDAYLKSPTPFWRHSLLSGLALPLRLLVYVPSRKFAVPGSIVLVAVVVAGLRRRPAIMPWALLLTVPIFTILVLDFLRGTQHAMFLRYAAAAAIAMPAAPVLAAASLRLSAGAVLGIAMMFLAAAGLGAPRDIGSPYFNHMAEAFAPLIAASSRETPIVVHDTAELRGMYSILEFSHVPGFFPRPVMRLQGRRSEAMGAIRGAAPDGRAWLVTSGMSCGEEAAPDWLRAIDPALRIVEPPVTVAPGGWGVCPRPAMELWLVEFAPAEASPPPPSSADSDTSISRVTVTSSAAPASRQTSPSTRP